MIHYLFTILLIISSSVYAEMDTTILSLKTYGEKNQCHENEYIITIKDKNNFTKVSRFAESGFDDNSIIYYTTFSSINPLFNDINPKKWVRILKINGEYVTFFDYYPFLEIKQQGIVFQMGEGNLMVEVDVNVENKNVYSFKNDLGWIQIMDTSKFNANSCIPNESTMYYIPIESIHAFRSYMSDFNCSKRVSYPFEKIEIPELQKVLKKKKVTSIIVIETKL